MQVGVLVAAGRLARRVGAASIGSSARLKPTFEHVNAIGRDASRAAALATVQVERADHLFSDVARKIEDTLTLVQRRHRRSAPEGKAFSCTRSRGVEVFREARRRARSRSRGDDEDALFI